MKYIIVACAWTIYQTYNCTFDAILWTIVFILNVHSGG